MPPPWMPFLWCMGIGAGKGSSGLVQNAVHMWNLLKRLGQVSGSSALSVVQKWMGVKKMRRHSTATLMGLTKKELVEYVRIAEHNQDVAEEALNQQAENVKDWMPVVHGFWSSLTDCSNAGVYCSVCKKKVWKEDYAWCNRKNKLRSNYCPNCGAKMDGDGNG